MARLRTLQGIANSLADSFMGRYNDISGYWALGLLYREALERAETVYPIELFGDTEQHVGAVASAVADRYRHKLDAWSALRRVELVRARVIASFGSHTVPMKRPWNHFGDPFELRFSLLDAAGREVVANRYGWCRPHDPTKELRSVRVNTDP